jgi:hypothetical protein
MEVNRDCLTARRRPLNRQAAAGGGDASTAAASSAARSGPTMGASHAVSSAASRVMELWVL